MRFQKEIEHLVIGNDVGRVTRSYGINRVGLTIYRYFELTGLSPSDVHCDFFGISELDKVAHKN